MRVVLSVFLLLAVPCFQELRAQNQAEKAGEIKPRVLLVYSSGEVFETITDIKDPDALEAITSPTPADRNTALAARRIRDNLEKKGIPVRLARVEDFSKDDWREVLSYDTIIIGSPARFWTMSWETKRFMDLVVGRIYILEGKARGKQFPLFATAEIENSSKTALDAMATVISDIKGDVPLRLNLNREMSQEDFDSAIDRFTEALAVLVR